VDPLVEQTMDAYGYCYQNPIKFIDPDGLSAIVGDFYDSDGNYLGNDGKKDGKVYTHVFKGGKLLLKPYKKSDL
jgi:hypothetical protein